MDNTIIIAIVGGAFGFAGIVVGNLYAARQAEKQRELDRAKFEAQIKAQIEAQTADTATEVEELVWKRTRTVIEDMQKEIDSLKTALASERAKRIQGDARIAILEAENGNLRKNGGLL